MKTKSGLITSFLICWISSSITAQSVIDELNVNDIYSIRIIQQSDRGFTDERNINATEDVRRIVNYLKKYNYRDLGMEEMDGGYDDRMGWKYQIVLNGWRDELYIFDDKVFIGKSAYRLPPGMIKEFDRIFRDL